MTLDLVLIGFGNVGRRVATLLVERAGALRARHGLDFRVLGIATRRHGCVLASDGLSAVEAARRMAGGVPLPGISQATRTFPDALSLIEEAARARREDQPGPAASRPLNPMVMVETTVLDVHTGQPAIDHIRAAFRVGMHVVTANKGPIACAYHDLQAEAARAGLQMFFEGAVMDGIPLFNLVRETLPGVAVTGFRGILNTTAQHILVEMERGMQFQEALEAMQRAGIAEADPSLDVEGWDAAAKTAALVNVLMGGRTTAARVERTGIVRLTGADLDAARGHGRRLRLVARGWVEDGEPMGRVMPEELSEDDLLAGLGPLDNAVILRTDLGGEIGVVQREGSLTHTAYAIVTDLVAVSRRI